MASADNTMDVDNDNDDNNDNNIANDQKDDNKLNQSANDIDDALYSRQLYVIDHASMKKMLQSTVLIAGLNGLGVEIAKNVILAGVKSVTIYDFNIVEINDLSSNFYLTNDSIGKQTRSECCINQLKSLNPYVTVNHISNNNITLESLIKSLKYDVIVLCNYSLSNCIKYNKITHDLNLKFISTDALGVFGQIFVDFGTNFECTDLNGEQPKQGMITHISKAKPGIVQVHEDNRHGLSDGDFIKFDEIEGMTELNTLPAQAIKVTSSYSFSIRDTSNYNAYTGNGLYYQIKQSCLINFNSLSSQISSLSPSLLQSDYGKSSMEHHVFYLSLQEYFNQNNNKLPCHTSIDDCNKFYLIFQSLCNKYKIDISNDNDNKLRDKYIELARCSSGVINPMCVTLGGIVAQEVLKGCSHKFTPIKQFLYIDVYECLPANKIAKNEWINEYKQQNNRYDDNIKVFGNTIQNKVLTSKMFLIGSGAIGCEMLKNWALMGVGCDANKNGHIYVTDMDMIEKSNLNRQFLFRNADINQSKSLIAAKNVSIMNNDINITSHQNKVGCLTENIYNYSFWDSLNCVCTALDNVSARLYVDAQCVYYNLPLLESGTLGTKGNTQIVVPKLTESYGSTRDPDEVGIPICTLKNFPNKIEHTIQWSRDDFEGEFKQIPFEINNYLENGQKYLNDLHINNCAEEIDILNKIQINLNKDIQRPLNFKQCIFWARIKFEKNFNHTIKQLLYNFPHDAVTTEGAKFWSPPKRAPNPIVFDENDKLHMGYIIAAANLRAFNYGLTGSADINEIKEMLQECVVPQFEINKTLKIAANDDEEKKLKDDNDVDMDYDEELKLLKQSLPNRKLLIGLKLNDIIFEADNNDNYHMDFITASSNLRARNYRIREKSLHDIKKIAANIIPAIATTTALVTGLISFEFYKLIQSSCKIISDYRSCYVNLALPLITMSEPVAAPITTIYKKGIKWNYTLWHTIEINNGKNMKISDLLKYFDDEWDMDLNMISFGNAMIYAFYMNAMKQMKRKKMKLSDLVEEVCKIKLDPNLKCLNFEVNTDYQNVPDDPDADDEPLLPTICVYLN